MEEHAMSELSIELLQAVLYAVVLTWIGYLIIRIGEYSRAIWELAWIIRLRRKIDRVLDGENDMKGPGDW
jgi:hypothetical protein